MQTVPGILLTSIRMVSTRPLCQGARRNTDKNTQHICQQSQQGQIRRNSGIPTEPVVSKPSGSGVPAEAVVPQPAEEIGAKIPAGMEPQQAPPADPAKPAVADPAGSEIPVEADGRHIQQANPIMEEAAPGSEPATAHELLSPEELEEFLDNQPDDAENEEFSAAPAKNEHTADTMSTVSDGLNEPVEAKPDILVASAPGNAIKGRRQNHRTSRQCHQDRRQSRRTSRQCQRSGRQSRRTSRQCHQDRRWSGRRAPADPTGAGAETQRPDPS